MRFNIALGLILVGGAVSAQNDTTKAESVRLIDSIQGPALYKAYCAVCHGTDGKGSGPLAQLLKARPSDLTHISRPAGGAFPLVRVEKIISGEEQVAGHGDPGNAIVGTNLFADCLGFRPGTRAHR